LETHRKTQMLVPWFQERSTSAMTFWTDMCYLLNLQSSKGQIWWRFGVTLIICSINTCWLCIRCPWHRVWSVGYKC
jgi:hypothetical protein